MSAPVSMSSKKRPPAVRRVIAAPRKARDPRFDSKCGTLDEQQFQQAYGFLDEKRKAEMKQIQKRLKKVKNAERKQELQRLLQSMKEQEKAREQKARQREAKVKRNKMVKDSKGKYFLKKSDQKKLELLSKFEKLKKSGKLDKALKNRRKHNLQKDKAAVGTRH
ncbi:hypothetical protein PTSG_06452 [Salpingoeca rosetta]|uniref:rRNA biogenesis protein RRP36 n=1 Tax=Salpingoeca rosetta (strain ATCC 50818 / BSB-021) TaxID=946362 RepID=F2UFU7_SALR5|nr:uncharacterized protein PTSG_06452 [Salpingoeca rosetta]EGD75375.1 hypothetical protein PTSG_06452 [Salpingoeca rosetta]|eukprot:XP_004991832.1 hypothetical protein PTSG_06452 [Salpingoeca rosetta]